MKLLQNILRSIINRINIIRNKISIDLDQIDNIEFEDIDGRDAPDFCDAYISEADCRGVAMTHEQLEQLDSDFVYEALMGYLY